MVHILILLCALFCASALADPRAPYYALEEAEFHFEEFINKYIKQYADEQEKAARFETFKSNLKKINQLNKRSKLATYGITPLLDLTTHEFFYTKTGLELFSQPVLCDSILRDYQVRYASAPESFDWRQQGAVTDVKDQGDCGSSYAYSAIANIESQYFIKYKKLVELSEQQIVNYNKTNSECDGGFMSNAFRTLKRIGGAVLESDYPYNEEKKERKFDRTKSAVKLSSCISMDLHSQENLKQLLYKMGPIAVAIDAESLMGYKGGIIEDFDCNIMPNHAVLLVGYGKENNEPYWILKNSWGKNFGEDGYFRLQRSNKPYGACGLMNHFMASAIVE